MFLFIFIALEKKIRLNYLNIYSPVFKFNFYKAKKYEKTQISLADLSYYLNPAPLIMFTFQK